MASTRVCTLCLMLGLGIPGTLYAQAAPAPAAPAHDGPGPQAPSAAVPGTAVPGAGASAPEPNADEPPTPPTTEPAAAGPAEPAEAIAADPEVLARARGHFAQGVAFADAGNCNGAIGEFMAAYRLIPRANALYNVAQCQERLFRYDLAIRYYERYLAEADADAPDRPAVEAALRTLGNLLATLHVTVNARAELWVDDRLAGEAPGDVLLPAGGHTIELRAKGFLPARREVRVVGREELDIAFTLEKARTTVRVTETTGLTPIVFWSGVAATVITAGVGTVFAIEVGDLHSRGTSLPARHPERGALQDDTESAQLTADIFFGTAAVLGVATVVVGLLTDWEGDAGRSSEEKLDGDAGGTTARVRLRPMTGLSHAGLRLEGQL